MAATPPLREAGNEGASWSDRNLGLRRTSPKLGWLTAGYFLALLRSSSLSRRAAVKLLVQRVISPESAMRIRTQ